MSNLDKTIFKNKKFSDILSEIYDNQKKKERQIDGLIEQLKPLMQEIGDATLLVPLIKEYIDMGIKNDDLLIKMASLIQKTMNKVETGEDDFGLSPQEKTQLLSDLGDLKTKNLPE